eukprot:1066611-Pelagomonas_calceolata.AAC.1
MGIWRVTGSIWHFDPAARSIIIFDSTPSGNKLVGTQNRTGMELRASLMARWWSSPSCLN